MTYTRKDQPQLRVVTDSSLPEHPDVMVIKVLGVKPTPIRLFNVYNPGREDTRSGEVVEYIHKYANRGHPEMYIGDFNMHHESWSVGSLRNVSRETVTWVERCQAQECCLIGPFEQTHREGGDLDLCWATTPAHNQ